MEGVTPQRDTCSQELSITPLGGQQLEFHRNTNVYIVIFLCMLHCVRFDSGCVYL